MCKAGFSMGFKPKKPLSKSSASSKPASKPNCITFGADSDNDSDSNQPTTALPSSKRSTKPKSTKLTNNTKPSAPPPPEAISITELDSNFFVPPPSPPRKKKRAPSPQTEPPTLKPTTKATALESYGSTLSSSLTTRRRLDEAKSSDANIFEYDAIYDTLKPNHKLGDKNADPEDKKSRYIDSLLASSSQRTRDRQVAETKKIAREREEEGEEYADKEVFVTAAYKQLQATNARLAEEERVREEEEAKKAEKAEKRGTGGVLGGFYRELLENDEERHARLVKAAEEKAVEVAREKAANEATAKEKRDREGIVEGEKRDGGDKGETNIKTTTNPRGGAVDIVDHRQLLSGGLNLSSSSAHHSKPNPSSTPTPSSLSQDNLKRNSGPGRGGSRAQQRARQTQMMEEQLAAQLKRSREEDEEEKRRIEGANKSRKTEAEISSAKERYLARKAAAAAAKTVEGGKG